MFNYTSSSKNVLLSSHIKIFQICLELFLLINTAWSVLISLLIQKRQLFNWEKQYYELMDIGS